MAESSEVVSPSSSSSTSLPADGAALRKAISSGKVHGTTAPQTIIPTGLSSDKTETLLYEVTHCTETNPAKWDLSMKMAKYLDQHFVLPVLDFLEERDIYPVDQIRKARLQILQRTKMVDYAKTAYQQLHPGADPPQEMTDLRARAVQEHRKATEEVGPFNALMDDQEGYLKMKQEGKVSIADLKVTHGITQEVMDAAFKFSRINYEMGNYPLSAKILLFYREIITASIQVASKSGQVVKDPHGLSALWGKLAAETLDENYDTALADLLALRDAIEAESAVPGQLQRQVWLVHWALFVFFFHQSGNENMLDLFRRPAYMGAIQTVCPYLLRYLTVAVITSKKRGTGRGYMRDLVRVIEQEQNNYMDPIVGFAFHLFSRFDFEGAQKCLAQCPSVLANDFFLTGCTDDFMQNAWLQLFEFYCRANSTVGIDFIGGKMGLDAEAAERWVVNLIREARIDARMDQRLRRIVIQAPALSPTALFREKVRHFSYRTHELANPSGRGVGGRGGYGGRGRGRGGGDRGDRSGGGAGNAGGASIAPTDA